MPQANPAEAVPFRASPAFELDARFAPNGKWVVFTSNESQTMQAYLSSFPERGAKVQLSEAGAMATFWSPQGDKVYFLSPTGRGAQPEQSDKPTVLMAVDLTTPEAFQSPANPYVVFESPEEYTHIEIAPDGKRFLAVRTQRGTPPIHIILNGIRQSP